MVQNDLYYLYIVNSVGTSTFGRWRGRLFVVGWLIVDWSIGRLVNWLVDWLVDLPANWCIVAFGEVDCWPLGPSMTSCCSVSIDCWLVDRSQGKSG